MVQSRKMKNIKRIKRNRFIFELIGMLLFGVSVALMFITAVTFSQIRYLYCILGVISFFSSLWLICIVEEAKEKDICKKNEKRQMKN